MLKLPQAIMAGQFKVRAGWTLGPIKNDTYELVYFPYGSDTEYEVNGDVHVLRQPSLIYTRAYQERLYRFDAERPVQHLFVQFRLPAGAAPPFAGISTKVVHMEEGGLLPQMLQQILLLAHLKPLNWIRRANWLLGSVLQELEGGMLPKDEFRQFPKQIQDILQYIEDHLSEPLYIRELSRLSGWTHEHFTRQFVKYTGYTPQNMIKKRRIDRACQYLIQSNMSIKDVAYAVGFSDEHYFSREFKKLKGINASQYRRKFADPRMQHVVPKEKGWDLYPINQYFFFDANEDSL